MLHYLITHIFQGSLASLNNPTPADVRRRQSALRVLKYFGLDNLVAKDGVMLFASFAFLLT